MLCSDGIWLALGKKVRVLRNAVICQFLGALGLGPQESVCRAARLLNPLCQLGVYLVISRLGTVPQTVGDVRDSSGIPCGEAQFEDGSRKQANAQAGSGKEVCAGAARRGSPLLQSVGLEEPFFWLLSFPA